MRELSGYEEYQLICSELTETPREPLPSSGRLTWWDQWGREVIGAVLLVVIVVAMVSIGQSKPDPYMQMEVDARDRLQSEMQELDALRDQRATLGEARLNPWEVESLDREIAGQEEDVAEAQARLRGLEQERYDRATR